MSAPVAPAVSACSFCGKPRHAMSVLVVGRAPGREQVGICDACLTLAVEHLKRIVEARKEEPR